MMEDEDKNKFDYILKEVYRILFSQGTKGEVNKAFSKTGEFLKELAQIKFLKERYGFERYMVIYYNLDTQTNIEFSLKPPESYVNINLDSPSTICYLEKSDQCKNNNGCNAVLSDNKSKKMCDPDDNENYFKPYDFIKPDDDPLSRWPEWRRMGVSDFEKNTSSKSFLYEGLAHKIYNTGLTEADNIGDVPIFKSFNKIKNNGKLAELTSIKIGNNHDSFDVEDGGFNISIYTRRNNLSNHFIGWYLIPEQVGQRYAALLLIYHTKDTNDTKRDLFYGKDENIGKALELQQLFTLISWPPLIGELKHDQVILDEKRMKHAKEAAIASIMGRNMSHNIGSHVLSSLKEDVKPKQVAVFHSYLQKRMDLLARITGEKPDWGEPMFFVEDLLKGFFNQTLLLNHLLFDQGGWKGNTKREKSIEFHIKLPNDDQVKFIYVEDKDKKEESWEPDSTTPYKDFMVSIPDGVIGAQAFYIFMESMMRNSVKYGKNRNQKDNMVVNINVEKANNEKGTYYGVKILDNLSPCEKLEGDCKTLTEVMQEKIKEELIDLKTGRLEAKSLGIAEMREACGFLIHPYGEDFPAVTVNKTNGPKSYPLWVVCPKCEDLKRETSCGFLTYTFNLAQPKMVAIVSDKIKLAGNADAFGIKKVSKADLLTNKGSFQFVLFDVIEENKSEVLGFIKKNHRRLPQRLLIYKKDVSSLVIEPERRAVTCSKEDFNLSLFENNIQDEKYEEFILKVYETWIEKRWLKDKLVDLCTFFERLEGDSIWEQWKKVTSSTILKDKAQLTVMWKNGEKVDVYSKEEKKYQRERENKQDYSDLETVELYYDNHSAASRNKTPYFKHETGSSNKKIFETLASPPKNQFGFDYFLLGLIEAGLTHVVIIDERVALSSIDIKNELTVDGVIPIPHLNRFVELNLIHCYPLFAFKKENNFELLTPALKESFDILDKEYNNFPILLGLKDGNLKICGKSDADNLIPDPDFIIFHNGVIETSFKDLFSEEPNTRTIDIIEKIYEITPSLVITSGRGKILKEFVHPDSPFIEFSTVKENTIQSISKYHLVRSLMSVKGGVSDG